MGIIYDCHSDMIATLKAAVHFGKDCGERTFYQKSIQANIETIVRCDKNVDPGSKRNLRHIRDRLAAMSVAENNFAD